MKSLGRNFIQTATLAAQRGGADVRPMGIDPQWSHTLAQPAL